MWWWKLWELWNFCFTLNLTHKNLYESCFEGFLALFHCSCETHFEAELPLGFLIHPAARLFLFDHDATRVFLYFSVPSHVQSGYAALFFYWLMVWNRRIMTLRNWDKILVVWLVPSGYFEFFCCCCQIMMTCYFKIMTGVCEFPAFSLPLCLELFNPTLYIYSQYRAARKNNLIRLESGPISCSVVHLKEMKVKLYFFVYIEKILPNQSKSPSLNSIIY